MKSVSKFKHQVKSSKYYLFWGAATIAVMAGQIYVGNGYRQMSESMDGISADINLLVEVLMTPLPKTMPVTPRSTGGYGGMPIIK